MVIEDRDKPMIKDINSNLVRAQQTRDPLSKLGCLLPVIAGSVIFSLVQSSRGDFNHARIYMTQAEIANKEIADIIAQLKREVPKE